MTKGFRRGPRLLRESAISAGNISFCHSDEGEISLSFSVFRWDEKMLKQVQHDKKHNVTLNLFQGLFLRNQKMLKQVQHDKKTQRHPEFISGSVSSESEDAETSSARRLSFPFDPVHKESLKRLLLSFRHRRNLSRFKEKVLGFHSY